jgi:hypothetical protein
MRPLTTAVRSPLAAFALAIGLLSGVLVGVGAAPPPAQAASPGFVVLLDGLCSTLDAGQIVPGTFAGEGGLQARLVAAGWSADSIVAYSYGGGSVDSTGAWRPMAYDCTQSRDQSLGRDAELLDAQLTAMAVAHPGAVFHLIGQSLGGLVAFAELARLATIDGWQIPGGARVGSVVSLDSPIGGVPFIDDVCALAPDECGGTPIPAAGSVLRSMSAIWASGTGTPAGATRSVAFVIPTPVTMASVTRSLDALAVPALVTPRRNEELAISAAADHGVQVLTVGNVRDWLYAPFGPSSGLYNFLDTQWLTSGAAGSGVYARAIDSGPSVCPNAQASIVASYSCNHGQAVHDQAVAEAILDLIAGNTPALAPTCPPGKGGCLMLPPRPAIVISSSVTAGVVRTGGSFTTSAVKVQAGTRATILFATKPALPKARIEIWARSQQGTYHFVTSRLADSDGVVRYYTPPVTAWTAYQARYPGDFVRGLSISAGRVVTVR